MEYFVSALWIGIELTAQYFFLKALLPKKADGWKIFITVFVQGLILFVIANFALPLFSDNVYLRKITNLMIGIICSFILFGGTWYNRIFAIVLWYLSLGVVDTIVLYGTAALLGIALSALIWKKVLYCIVVTTGKLLFLFLAWIFDYIRTRSTTQSLSKKKIMLLCLFPLVSIFALLSVFTGFNSERDLSTPAALFSVFLALSNIAILYLISSIDRATKAEHELIILNQSMALQTENICALEKSYRAQRSATHEFKHRLQVIYDLLDQGEIERAKDYIQQLQITQTSRIFVSNTKHPIIDAILNEKYHVAKENSIDMSFKVNDLSKLTISTDELVVLLSNLLDNAIEACQRLPDNIAIECTILLEKTLFISIRNTSAPVKIVNGRIETSKKPEKEHGFGLAGVLQVLEQLNGEYAMNYSDNWFQFVAEIPM